MMLSDRERVNISKFLSLVLRHRPVVAGVTLDAAGWVDVSVLLEGCRQAGRAITPEQLREVVETNDKKRFEFCPDGRRIRASQGHSVDVNLGYAPATPPELLYHGTASRHLQSIRAQGLRRRSRHHVHLSIDSETAVKVGQRHGKPVVLQVQASRMHADGHAFFVSANNVWLTDHVPARYLVLPSG